MKTEDIREAFLSFFESKQHTRVESASLVPLGDPTLLFTNAGMVPFKDTFLGTEKRSYSRATTCQKSLRISGKHNDLENVGRTARHHTFFEMLGNFSFGDYFKEDAIKYAWEFVTENLELSKDRLWVTVYEDDDEAAKLWAKNTDVAKDRILRCGEKDNFWAMGDTGPCGPCSEIFYYLGDNVDGQNETEFRLDDGTYMEIWNLVFMQFNRSPAGELDPLPKPSVDTGMGLERVAAIKQKGRANYDTDLLRGLIAVAEKLSGKTYVGDEYTPEDSTLPQHVHDVAMRVIADHARACTFLIADGVSPSSDGRGYVLRRLVRRACRHARALGLKEAFLYKVASEVVSLMGGAYPEIVSHQAKIEKTIRLEEEKFLTTLDAGMGMLDKEVATLREQALKVFPGTTAFQLHDTYGFPLDLTEDIVSAAGLSVDKEGFSAEMERQRERSRSARATETAQILQRSVKPVPSKFVGYEFEEYESTVLGMFSEDGEKKTGTAGMQLAIITEHTPFYAESGGQIGDTGSISSNDATLDVIDTQKIGGDSIVHICSVDEGSIKKGDKVRLSVDTSRRERLRVNHSATHLLHLALQEVLGDHVKQAGSRVSDSSLRFDFDHFEAITRPQLEEIEDIVNQQILENHPIDTSVMSIDDAKQGGAKALFGEKYGEEVRVVSIGPRSKELCGGTHAKRSGDIGVVRIVSEGAISSGVRRVEAVAGRGALERLKEQRRVVDALASALGANESSLLERTTKLLEQNRELEKQLQRASQQANQARGGDLAEQAKTLDDGTKVVIGKIDEASPKQLREMADDLRERLGSGCIALGSVANGKVALLTAVTEDLTERFHAGNLLREMAAEIGGKGGGRADLAQAGGGDPEKIDLALQRFEELLQ